MIRHELLKGSIKTIILHLLEMQGRMYGYEITKYVKTLSEEQILLTEGALYPMLHKMESEGLLKVERVPMGKRVRKYYSLTPEGAKAAVRHTQEFVDYVQAMKLVLKPKLPCV